MAITCPVDLDTRRLRDEIRSIYARVADEPSGEFHFHRGPDYAADLLQYDREALAALPDQSTVSFAGVGNPHRLESRVLAGGAARAVRRVPRYEQRAHREEVWRGGGERLREQAVTAWRGRPRRTDMPSGPVPPPRLLTLNQLNS
jgi:hypothetical protein